MTRKEIIEIVKAMDHSQDYRDYYQFAHTYLLQMKNKENDKAADFWAIIQHCRDTAERKNTIKAMGKSGKGYPETIKRWCNDLLRRSELKAASLDNLCSIFGYCAHLGR